MKIKFLLSLLAGGLLVAACEKEEVDCPPQPIDNGGVQVNPSLLNTFVRAHEAPTQTFTVDPALGTSATVVTTKGTRITIPAGAFVQANGTTPVTGAVQLAVREIRTKSEMVLSAMPTTASGEMLVSGGQYFLRATQNNQRLRLKSSARINIRTANIPRPDVAMRLFFGVNSGGNVNWVPAPQQGPSALGVVLDSTGQGNFYNITLNNDSLGWVNIDRYMNLNPKTTVSVAVPGNDVEPANTMVFYVFNSFNTVARGYVAAGQNTVATANIPVGQSVTAVVIRLVNGQYYFGKQTATVAAGQQYTPTLRALSEADLLAEVQQL
ncbi:hypothetical protein EJV47_14715 [Hymenobacter gummosus]|uniref:Uncharacterized protein n=1 Tax=Hymenobacter gummosus TaxID=1776032 RepID=A0A3S0HME3_9BACT|nr:hypothetical protein [Hymenobacter gummosus]RTQ48848.1 hypothetical protein EJV47_14715 [Hymenobacter gummosus]